MRIVLERFAHTPSAAFGYLRLPNRDNPFFTVERAWRNNERDVSCIPRGIYYAAKDQTQKHGSIVRISGVCNRHGILIHKANYAYQLAGCIGVGMTFDGDSVRQSKVAMTELLKLLPSEFEIQIRLYDPEND